MWQRHQWLTAGLGNDMLIVDVDVDVDVSIDVDGRIRILAEELSEFKGWRRVYGYYSQ